MASDCACSYGKRVGSWAHRAMIRDVVQFMCLSRSDKGGDWRQAKRGCRVKRRRRSTGAAAQVVGSARRDCDVTRKGKDR
eukprot:5409881-Pleurochrysis_carterae.AAC.1